MSLQLTRLHSHQALLLQFSLCCSQGFHAVAGVDEAGRGPLAGPVVAAAVVVVANGVDIQGVNDSKKLDEVSPSSHGVQFYILNEKFSSLIVLVCFCVF